MIFVTNQMVTLVMSAPVSKQVTALSSVCVEPRTIPQNQAALKGLALDLVE